jgi:hypothetical protein
LPGAYNAQRHPRANPTAVQQGQECIVMRNGPPVQSNDRVAQQQASLVARTPGPYLNQQQPRILAHLFGQPCWQPHRLNAYAQIPTSHAAMRQ